MIYVSENIYIIFESFMVRFTPFGKKLFSGGRFGCFNRL